jgi:hypothetical protein
MALLRCASLNVLADAWLDRDNYTNMEPHLFQPGARIPNLLQLIASLQAHVIALQEVEAPLVAALAQTGEWKPYWSQKQGGEPDGCLTLVRHDIQVEDDATYVYSDGTYRVMQSVTLGNVVFANTHIQYAPPSHHPHLGVAQTKELLGWLGEEQPAVILADCNDRPGGPVRALIEGAGFYTSGNEPTALIGEERAALDIIAVRGVRAEHIKAELPQEVIPNANYPSDHIPVMAYIEID